jgi:RNA polymerase sigma-70 factor, ECF subfamily
VTSPETRHSLLLRLRDRDDQEAWDQFSKLYRPVVYRMAIAFGMQSADAEDLAQQVLAAILHSIERFEPDRTKARFRTWLRTVARRSIINVLTRRVVDAAEGGSSAMMRLTEEADPTDETQTLLLHYRRQIFREAAFQIRDEFQAETWTAFWRTVVDSEPIDRVAQELGRSRGNVYTARSRVMARLKQKVQELDDRGES